MPRRRVPHGFNQRVVSAVESMIPGTLGGRLSNASPAPSLSDMQAAVDGTLGTAGQASGIEFWYDTFTLAGGGAQDVTLTYLPLLYSEHIYLNGVEQQEGTDYTRAGQVISILTAMGVLTGDLVEVRYAYDVGAPASPPPASIVDDFNRADAATLGSTSDGNGAWTDLVGVCGISSNRAYVSTFSPVSASYLRRGLPYIDTGAADGTLQATLYEPTAPGTIKSSIAFRIQDDTHYWVLGGTGLSIVTDLGGALGFTLKLSAPVADGDTAKVILTGSTIAVYVNGAHIGDVTDSTYLTETKHGLEFELPSGGRVGFADDWSFVY